MSSSTARDIVAACQHALPDHFNDCSGFARDVASRCGVFLFGDANQIVDTVANSWIPVRDGLEAATMAAAGFLVIAGAAASGHGHVVIVVDGPTAHGRYPYAFWGAYHGLHVLGETVNVGFTRGHGTVNWAFGAKARKKLVYGAAKTIPLLTEKASGSEGFFIPR